MMRDKSVKQIKYHDFAWDFMLGVMCLVAGATGLKLVYESNLWSSIGLGESTAAPIGTLHRQSGSVRYRPNRSPLWHDVNLQQTVASGDTVFTGDSSIARVQLSDGNSIDVLPNSLIVLQGNTTQKPKNSEDWLKALFTPVALAGKDKSSIDLKEGSIKPQFTGDTSTLAITAKGKTYQITSENQQGALEIAVGANNEDSALRFLSGDSSKFKIDALSALGDKTIVLEGQKSANVAATGEATINDIFIEPAYPLEGAKVIDTPTRLKGSEGKIPVAFQWKWIKKPDKKHKIQIELKDEQKPEEIIPLSVQIDLKNETTVQLKTVLLNPGRYDWRVVAVDSKQNKGNMVWNKFHVTALAPPTITAPSDQSEMTLENADKRQISLSWEPQTTPLMPEIEITRKGSSMLKILKGKDTGLVLNLKPGTYLWRARSTIPGDKHSEWSNVHHFTVSADSKNKIVPLPAILQAAKDTPKKNTDNASNKRSPATNTEQELSQMMKLQTLNDEKPQIEGEDEEETNVPTPTAQVLSLDGEEGFASTRLGKTLNLTELPVLLKWKNVQEAEEYLVEVFERNGSTYKETTVTSNQAIFILKSLEKTEFFYQVTAKLKNGDKIQSKKVPVRIEILPPIPREPANDSTQTARDVLLTWEKTSLTREYQIQIAKDYLFMEIVHDKKLTENFESFRPKYDGIYYWRVRSLTINGQSKWSDLRSFFMR